VRAALADVPGDEHDLEQARYLADTLRPAMDQLREACDALERRTDGTLWPFPTYHQMLFQ
jgi:glutamine synthetase